MKTRVTVESLTEELEQARVLGLSSGQPGAATQATIAKGKLHGLIVERKEQGQPGDFASLKRDEVIAKVRSELGDSAAAHLQAALARLDAVDSAEHQTEQIIRNPGDSLN